ncbi:MAG: ABC1 kinase family protein [Nitriliruptoraceae bacterium]
MQVPTAGADPAFGITATARNGMGLLSNLVVVLLSAWVVRALLGAHQVTWGRLVAAVIVGAALGAGVAALLVIDVTAPIAGQLSAFEDQRGPFTTVALPFQVLTTMLTVVVLELLFARPTSGHPVGLLSRLRRSTRWFGLGWRSLRVARIASRHGLAPALGLRRGELDVRSPEELARRARLALEDAGGMFVKLGQLLATRPDLLPPGVLAELGRLHAGARPLPRSEAEAAIRAELPGPLEEIFAEVDWQPIGSASIAQVHAARLRDGREVVVKVRRPGLVAEVERDLAIAVAFARLAERRTAWGRTYEVGAIAQDFANSLRRELDLRIEARHAAEIAQATAGHALVRVPSVVENLTTQRLVVMDRLAGTPLSSLPPGVAEGDVPARRRLADELCASQLEAMLQGQRFHGDPHPGNVLLLDDLRLGLIDFGVTGRLDAFERASVLQMLLALQLGEPSLLYESLVAVGAVPPTRDPDAIERELARYMAANLGSGLPPASALTDLLRLTTQLGFRLPPQTSTMFRALATLAGTLELMSPDYPLIEQVAALGGAEFKQRSSPSSVAELVQREWAQLGPLLQRAPRHLDRLATLAEHGRLTTRVRLFADAEDVAVAERLVNRVVLTALSLGLGLLATLLLATEAGPVLAGGDLRLVEVLGWLGLFGSAVLFLRVLLQVLRPPEAPEGRW